MLPVIRECQMKLIVFLGMAMLTCGGVTNANAQVESQQADTEWRGYNGGYDATRFLFANSDK